MCQNKRPTSELWEPFLFSKSSERLQFVKQKLMQGYSFIVEPVYAERSVGYLAHVFDSAKWTTDEIMSLTFLDGGLGMNELHGLGVFSLGTANRESALIDETLSAGFPICLVADISVDGVAGAYILRASISDNT